MDLYVIFQLFVDIFLLVLIIAFVVRDSSRQAKLDLPRVEELRELVEELQESLRRGERAARDLDEQLKVRSAALEALRKLLPDEGIKAASPSRPPSTDKKSFESTSLLSLDERKRRVKELRRKGIPREEIAQRLAMPLSEVELILKMAGGAD